MGSVMGLKKYFYVTVTFTSLFLLFYNIVSKHCGRCGGRGSGGLPPKNLSKTGSFLHKNT